MKVQGIVLDASVLLNILGSGHDLAILNSIPGRCIVAATTAAELTRHPLSPRSKVAPLDHLTADGAIEVVALGPSATARFIDITGAAPPDDLDDGEAACLALAEQMGFSAAIDEAKGRRVATSVLPAISLECSCSLFAHPLVARCLGNQLSDALYGALLHSRMRVRKEHANWVIDHVGEVRARDCPSLRRYLLSRA